MDQEGQEEPTEDPRFIPGIYNYCDAWCERCTFTARCRTYAMSREMEAGNLPSRDAANEAFWNKLDEVSEEAMETEEPEGVDFEMDEEELQESIREYDEVHEAAQAQPYSRTARRYIEIADSWLQSHEGLVGDKGEGPVPPTQMDTPRVESRDAPDICDCLDVILWYQRQMWVKLCRAASGTIRAEGDELDYVQQDADGSAKVAIIGIERSMAAWATLLRRFPDHEDALFALGTLKRLLRQVEAAFPNARAFRRPGFDTDGLPPAD